MNVVTGVITGILTEDEISLVRIDANGCSFTSIVIDTPADGNYLQLDHIVDCIFKETEVMIARTSPLAISVQNKIPCTIKKITIGKILCQIELQIISGSGPPGTIGSIITRNACEQLQLKEEERVTALIKTNEVSLSVHKSLSPHASLSAHD